MRRLLGFMVGLLVLLGGIAWGATTYKYTGSIFTATALTLTTLTDTSYSPQSSVISNTPGSGGDGSLLCAVEGALTFAAAPTAGSVLHVWLLGTIDGANYEDPPPALGRMPDAHLPVSSGQVTTRIRVAVACPLTDFKVIVRNASTGQTISTGTIKILFKTLQGL